MSTTQETNNPTESEAKEIIDNHHKEGFTAIRVQYNDDGPKDLTNVKKIILMKD